MSNAFAPRPFEDFEDEFDLDMGYAAAPGAITTHDPMSAVEPAVDPRQPLQFTAPAVPAPGAQSALEAPILQPAADAFNPVGELVAGAAGAVH